MARFTHAWLGVCLLVSACSPPLAGRWKGSLACGEQELLLEIELEGAGLEHTGTGTRTELLSGGERGTDVDVIERFTVSLNLPEGRSAQDVDARFLCDEVETVAYKVGRVEPSSSTADCVGEPMEEYDVAWDGADVLDVSGPDGCAGELDRLGR